MRKFATNNKESSSYLRKYALKTTLTIIIIAIFLLSLTSCDNSNSSGNEGNQSAVSANSSDNNASLAESNDETSTPSSNVGSTNISDLYGMWMMETGAGFKFSEDGTGSRFWLEKDDPNTISSETKYTYEVNGDQLQLHYIDSGFSPTYGFSIDGDTLTINENGHKSYYKRL